MVAPLTTSSTTRYPHLDGIRALAAWYVVLHHTWIETFIGFPENTGPWVVGSLRWGHLAVAVFIVLSGFSLALSPARHGDQLVGGVRTFLGRRAWRILPPYWVALAISVVVLLAYTGSASGIDVTVKSVVVHALLLQDLIGSQSPNGAFWSIAVEWQIYFTFPALLWMVRRRGPVVMAAITTAFVAAAYVVAINRPEVDKVLDLSPQFLALFALGMAAGSLAVRHPAPSPTLRRWLPVGIAVAVAGALAVLAFGDPGRVVDEFFWVDLTLGALMAVVLYALATGMLRSVARGLSWGPLATAGTFSYSTYLIHVPILAVVRHGLVNRWTSDPVTQFVAMLVVSLPLVYLGSRGFSVLFERPFVEHRSWSELRAAAQRRTARWARRPAVHAGSEAALAVPPSPKAEV